MSMVAFDVKASCDNFYHGSSPKVEVCADDKQKLLGSASSQIPDLVLFLSLLLLLLFLF